MGSRGADPPHVWMAKGENIFKEFEKLIVQPEVESAMVVKVCGAKRYNLTNL